MRSRSLGHSAIVSASLLMLASPAVASWPTDPAVNLPVCTAAGDQGAPGVVSDGQGGALLAWQDPRSGAGTPAIYAQHVLGSGTVDPAWPAGGRVLSAGTVSQYEPAIVSDGAGGAIVAWMDFRGSYDIYAQHVLASGAVDPAWPAGGDPVCTADNGQFHPKIASDGAHGAIVTWEDLRNGGAHHDVYAGHVLASGAMDPAWPANGRALGAGNLYQYVPTLASDGAGGAIVTWEDYRTTYDIYAQHVLASGAVDPAWPAGGLALCAATGDQLVPAVVADGTGGAIVTWEDLRNGGTNHDIYAQHALASGTVDAAWPADGRALCGAANNQVKPVIAPDGAGGAIASWEDYRGGSLADVYAQHVAASGGVDAAWPIDGAAVTAGPHGQYAPAIVPDGLGGAIVAWKDARSGLDVYAQHLLASGARDPVWPAGGQALCTAPHDQLLPALVVDGSGGAIVAWQDQRSGADYDVYAQRVLADGSLGGDVTAVSGPTVAPGTMIAPNPARGAIGFSVAKAGAGDGVEVLDVAGRRLWQAPIASGVARWNGVSQDGRHVAPGVYVVRFRLRTGVVARRFAWLQ